MHIGGRDARGLDGLLLLLTVPTADDTPPSNLH